MKYLISLMLISILMFSCNSKKAGLDKFINDLDNPQKADVAIISLEKLGPKAMPAYDKLLAVLKKDDSKTASKVFRVILKLEDPKKVIEAAKIGINSKHRSVSTLSVNVLKKIKNPSPEVINVIVSALSAPEKFTKEAAIIAVGELKVKAAVPELIKILLNKSLSQHIILNKLAARSLGQIDDPRAIKPLIKALFIIKNDKKNRNVGSVFVLARNSLTGFGKAALSEILLTLDGKNEDFNAFKKATPAVKDSDVTYNMLVMIGEIGSKENFKILEKYLHSEDSGVRINAEGAMGNLRMAEAVPVLIKRYFELKKRIPKVKEDDELKKVVDEVTNINRMLAQIGSKEAHKHVMAEVLGAPVKVDGEEFNDLKDDAAGSLSLFAGPEYYESYKQYWVREKDAARKKGIEKLLKVMEIPNKCKQDVKCYIDFLGKKGKKNTFMRQKAAYMLSRFNTPESKDALFNKALFDKDPGVRAAAAYSIDTIGTKADLKAIEDVIAKAKKKHSMKKSMSLLCKIKSKLKNK